MGFDNQFTGIGYVLAEDDPYTGVDFDKCKTGDVILPEVLDAIPAIISGAQHEYQRQLA